MLCCGIVNAEKGTGQSVRDQNSKQGDTIWLEEKISPTTRWLDNLVKPLTVWIEQQIHESEDELNNKRSNTQNKEDVKPALDETQEKSSDSVIEPISLIGVEQAATIAKEHIAGEVLYLSLIHI